MRLVPPFRFFAVCRGDGFSSIYVPSNVPHDLMISLWSLRILTPCIPTFPFENELDDVPCSVQIALRFYYILQLQGNCSKEWQDDILQK